jgi:hypothetical protein
VVPYSSLSDCAVRVSISRRALRPSQGTWHFACGVTRGQTSSCRAALVRSDVVAANVVGCDIQGKLHIARGLTGRVAEWRVPLADLGARLGELTAPRV